MSTPARAKLYLALLLVTAFAARLAGGVWWQSRLPEGTRFGFGDSESYWYLAQAMAAGRSYEYGPADARVFRTPGYPLLLAAMFKLTGQDRSVLWGRATSALFGTLAVGGVYWYGRELFDERTGLLAALLATFYPGAVATGGFVLSEAPFGALMLLQFILWHRGWQATNVGTRLVTLFSAGLVAGAATLIRPSWLLFTPLAVLVGLAVYTPRKRHLVAGCLLLAGLGVAMVPWWVRNARVIGRFVPTTLQVGASLYDGLNPSATGASNMEIVDARAAQLKRSWAAKLPPTDPPLEYRLNQALRNEAAAWARAATGRTFQLAAIKFARMWNFWPNEESFRSAPLRTIVMVTYVPVVVLGLLGAWKFYRRSWTYLLCIMPAFYLTLIHLVFVGSIRYRQPAMLTWIVLAAAVLTAGKSASGEGSEKSRGRTLNTEPST